MAIDERDGFFSSALSSKSIASTDVKDFQFSHSLKIVISAWLLYEDGEFNDPCNGKPSRDCHNNWWKMYWNYPCILKYGKCVLNYKNPRRERYMIFRQLEYEKLWLMALILRKTARSGNFFPRHVSACARELAPCVRALNVLTILHTRLQCCIFKIYDFCALMNAGLQRSARGNVHAEFLHAVQEPDEGLVTSR